MKRTILLFTFLFTLSSSFLSCRDAATEAETGVAEDEINTEVFEDEPEVAEGFAEFDEDNDGMWNEEEFMASNDQGFGEWDENQDDALDNNEFYNVSFNTADVNGDGTLDQNEWMDARQNMAGDYLEEDDWDLFDANDDDLIDDTEWNEGLADSDWFGTFDADDDELVDNDEWNTGLFDDWDMNDDGFLDEEEWEENDGLFE